MLRTIVVLCLVVLSGGCASTRKVDVAPGAAQAMRMEVVPLQFAAAQELAAVLVRWNDGNANAATRVSVIADVRTNSLILSCPKEQSESFERTLELIARLDVEATKSP